MNLIKYGKFMSAAGKSLNWKIECDALSTEDIEGIAQLVIEKIGNTGMAYGVPSGGVRLAEAYNRKAKHFQNPPALLMDDVWTTGKSMKAHAKDLGLTKWRGFVIFSRAGMLPDNVEALFTVNPDYRF